MINIAIVLSYLVALATSTFNGYSGYIYDDYGIGGGYYPGFYSGHYGGLGLYGGLGYSLGFEHGYYGHHPWISGHWGHGYPRYGAYAGHYPYLGHRYYGQYYPRKKY